MDQLGFPLENNANGFFGAVYYVKSIWNNLLCCAKFVQKKTSERNLSNGVTEYHFHVALIAMLYNQTLGCDH